jgi:CHAT domain-containing protein
LWDVNNLSTAAYFMKVFYRRLFNHPDHATALGEAIVEVKERKPGRLLFFRLNLRFALLGYGVLPAQKYRVSPHLRRL